MVVGGRAIAVVIAGVNALNPMRLVVSKDLPSLIVLVHPVSSQTLKHHNLTIIMQLKDVKKLELPASGDFHVHLRDGAMMETVVPSIREGGVDVVYVMVCS